MIDESAARARPRAPGSTTTPTPASAQALWSGLREHFPAGRRGHPAASTSRSGTCSEALETARCFDEGVIESAAAANIGSIMGIGFPPLYRRRRRSSCRATRVPPAVGLTGFVARARELAAAYGERFEPPAYVVDLAEKGERFPA